MQFTQTVPIVSCLIVVTYLMFVGAISWVAWSRHDDGIRGLAMALCTSTLAYVLISVGLPDAVESFGYYLLTAQAHVFFQYGVLKNFEKKMYWILAEVPVLVLLLCLIVYRSDEATLASICHTIYALQFAVIAITAVGRKIRYTCCGKNMVMAGMLLATGLSLWWAYLVFRNPEYIQDSAHPENYQTHLDFLIYTITLLTSNGFILMTKERVQAALEGELHYDEITGLASGRRLPITIRKHLARLAGLKIPVTLLLLDIDHFKQTNLRYSYATGNRILRELGQLLAQRVPEAHDIFRIHDDSFAILMPSLSIYQVAGETKALLADIAAHTFAGSCQITASCGISVACASDTAESWLARTQHALQKAKTYGRNQMQADELDFTSANQPDGVARVGCLHWHPNNDTGHAALDAQHRQLFERTNVLLQIWVRGASPQTVSDTVARFLELTETHFSFENDLLRQMPDIADYAAKHQANHQRLQAQAHDHFNGYQKHLISVDTLFSYLIFELVIAHTRIEIPELRNILQKTKAERASAAEAV